LLNRPRNDVATALNRAVFRRNLADPFCLPDFRAASALLVASDYSGEHAKSPFLVSSWLFVAQNALGPWEQARSRVRRQYLGKRRMSYKGLGDKMKAKALGPFLETADRIPGLCVTLAVHKRLGGVAEGIDTSQPGFAEFALWPRASLSKAVELAHFLGVLLASLSRPNQDVLWFSDQDEIAANTARLSQLTKLVAVTCSDYLEFSLGNLRCGTTASDAPDHGLEDLAAIPDLVAGALAECVSLDPRPDPPEPEARWDSQRLSAKANAVVRWFFRRPTELKRLACVIEPGAPEAWCRVSFLKLTERGRVAQQPDAPDERALAQSPPARR
jgi:hypothetical protein